MAASTSHEIKIGRYSLAISNWDKLLFPKDHLSKGDLINYYEAVSDYMLPYFKDRVLTIQRFPNGIAQEGFYQKTYQDYFPDFIKAVRVKLIDGSQQRQVVINKTADLIYLVGQAAITYHTWLSKINTLHKPTRLLFDLDPPSAKTSFKILIKAALAIKAELDALSLTAYVMTTGSKGLHIMVPIQATLEFDRVRDFVRKIAEKVASDHPQEFTTLMRKTERKGRLFLDYTRNAYAQTSVVPYSLRALPGAPVATPLRWDELSKIKSSQVYTIKNILQRLSKIENPWHDFQKNTSRLSEKILQSF